jgi:D-alanine-D-alanine ligase-like ATP-grasp enzyme
VVDPTKIEVRQYPIRAMLALSKRGLLLSPTTFEISFVLPANASPEITWNWIRILDKEAKRPSQPINQLSKRDHAQTWLAGVLQLSITLLQELYIPIFEPIKILKCDQDKKNHQWRATCSIPANRPMSHEVLQRVLAASAQIAIWCNTKDSSSKEHLFQFLKILENKVFNTPGAKAIKSNSMYEVLRVASARGIPHRILPGGGFQLAWGSQARYVDRSISDQDSAMGMRWSQNKFLSAQMLRSAGLPTPTHFKANTLTKAQHYAKQIGYPLVIKPVDLERGEGVSMDVSSKTLEDCFHAASSLSPSQEVLIEEQVPGICHRIFVVRGSMLYAVRRLPIGIYADGTSTISKLVEDERELQATKPPWKQTGSYHLDAIAEEALSRLGWNAQSVPRAGEFVGLRRIETTAWGGVDEDVTKTIHPDNISIAISAARILGLEVAGVDIISENIEMPWHQNGAVINEVNFAPLLGGGAISRSHISEYLDRIISEDDAMQIDVFIGEERAHVKAHQHWEMLNQNGGNAILVDDQMIVMPDRSPLLIPIQEFIGRINALLMRRDVQALVIVASSMELVKDIDAHWSTQAMQNCIRFNDTVHN